MKYQVIISKKDKHISFYMVTQNNHRLYLFTQKFSKGVFEYFQNGRHESELRRFKGWKINPKLGKTIEKIPMYVRYALKQEAA